MRVDHALESHQVVSTSYDPMLGKVIVHGPDRESARHALVAALDDTAVLGLTTNTGFLRALAASDAFRDATIDTAWLDAVDLERRCRGPTPTCPGCLVAWTSAMITALDAGHPFQADGFRLGGSAAPTLVELDRDVVVDRAAGTVDGVPVHQVSRRGPRAGPGRGRPTGCAPWSTCSATSPRWPGTGTGTCSRGPTGSTGPRRSPTAPSPRRCPARSSTSACQVGGTVAEGDVLGTLEAMKMELALKAPFAGTVVEVDVAVGAPGVRSERARSSWWRRRP